MTTIEAVKFAANVQIGTIINMGHHGKLEVTKITDRYFKGFLILNGKKVCDGKTTLHFDTILNNHYNKNISL
jgi:hypothetical protein